MSNCTNDTLFSNFKDVGIQTNLKDALEDVGVKLSSNVCLWEYPDIIRKNLVAKTVSGINILGNDVIHIDQESDGVNVEYRISTEYNTYNTKRPNYAPENEIWNNKISMEELINDLFDNILPSVRGIHYADITETDSNGIDKEYWNNTLFSEKGKKDGLKKDSRYLRLYLTCQAEPLFVYIEDSINDLTKVYNIENSDTVFFEMAEDLTLSAHINCISLDQINAL